MTTPTPRLRSLLGSATAVAVCLLALPAIAGPREQAKRMHDRIVGIPPSAGVLDAMAARIASGNAIDAAYMAMDDPEFYTSALKNWITPWTNVDRTVFAPLNDYTATVIGIIRDDRPFTDVLSADLVYVGAGNIVGVGYSHTDNDHYDRLERDRVDLSDPSKLVPRAQSSIGGSAVRADEAAGILTTRAAAQAFFSAGTNRRMLRFTAINYLCRDMEELKDITLPADRIRQDVNRSPGGDSEIFHNTCNGCHTGMDPLAGAFAYFNWDEDQQRLIQTRGRVQPKYLINSGVFTPGYITVDNRWDNYWRSGQNSLLGWRGNVSGGYGAQTMGAEIANSRAFSECQVKKVFEHLCFRPPGNAADRAQVIRIADAFEGSNYSMKRVFAEVAAYCMGD